MATDFACVTWDPGNIRALGAAVTSHDEPWVYEDGIYNQWDYS